MLFNSIAFALFLPLVFVLYWLIGRERFKVQNAFMIVASYVFYGWWDWRFLFLIFISSLADFIIGSNIPKTESPGGKKVLLILSLAVNLGILGFFKYFNFFVDSFGELMQSVGLQPNLPTLRIILPVGISFYTFQTLSYTLDIYRGKLKPTHDPVAFFAFVSFFPQLVAGPIERAKNLLPQFYGPRIFDRAKAQDGLRQMLWGFAKKMIVADTMAPHVKTIFDNADTLDGLTLLMGAFFFAMQIYCDFSGYSDIAIGASRLFGFELSRNFAYPYFSRDIGEFWRRWHISLSSWFRDYVYIPMGGSFVPKSRQMLNIFITFTVSGLWHGANWTFVVWGALNGLYYFPLMLANKQGQYKGDIAGDRWFPPFNEAMAMLGTFLITLLAWVFFRAASIGDAGNYIFQAFSTPWLALDHVQYFDILPYAIFPLVVEWFRRTRQHGLEISDIPQPMRWVIYLLVITGVVVFGKFGSQEFIYFQF
jgi:alginate O-acetyltransferase complex protein AlgI